MASNGETEGERLFFALWPDAAVRHRLVQAAAGARSGGRPVPAENLHVTLAFLGAVDAGTRACLEAAASRLDTPLFDLAFDHLGYFPRPQVVWIGCQTVPPALADLATGLQRAIAACGARTEERPFRAHVTLRRRARCGPRPGPIEPIPWSVQEFALVRSRTLPEGACYEVVRRWRLREPMDEGRGGVSLAT